MLRRGQARRRAPAPRSSAGSAAAPCGTRGACGSRLRPDGPRIHRITIDLYIVTRYDGVNALALPPRRTRAGARRAPRPHRWGRRLGARPPHRPGHQPGSLPPVGLGGAVVHRARPQPADPADGDGRCPRRHAARQVGAGDPRPRHPRGDGGGARAQSRIAPRTAVAKPHVGRDRHRHRGPVRRRGPDHRDRRRDRLAPRAGPPGLAVRAQDPARQRRGGRHGGDVRRAAGRGRARHRAAAVRVLDPGVRPARRRRQRRRRDAPGAVRRRSAVLGAGPRLRRASTRSRCSCCSASPAGCSPCVIARGLFLVEAGFRRLPVGEFWHPVIGAVGFGLVGLLVPRALGVGYDAIGDVLAGPPGARRRRRARGRRSCWPGGSRSARAPRAARSRRSC